MNKRKTLSFVLLIATFLYSINSLANNQSFSIFKLKPSLELDGYVGQGILGNAQGLIPISGDTTHVFYIDLQGKAGTSSAGWMFGGGLGYRKVFCDRIWGGYLLANYNATPSHNKFGVINPGIESLGENWDFFFNGYIPIRKNLFDATLTSNQTTDYDVSFVTHNEYHTTHLLQENSAIGADLEIGRKIPLFQNLKFYAGGYHFDSKGLGTINGGTARLDYQLNNYLALETRYSYDNNQKNILLFGLKLSLGGIPNRDQQGISGRLLDPINNNIATVGKAYAVPITKKTQHEETTLAHDGVWFFEPSTSLNSSGDGTYEHPFIGFNQQNYQAIGGIITSIDTYPLLYFSPGSYAISGFNDANNRILVNNGFSFYGRTSDFKSANEEGNVVFNGGFDIKDNPDDSSVTLDSIKIVNDQDNAAATIVAENSNILFNNAIIEHSYNDASSTIEAIHATNSVLAFVNGNNTVTSYNSSGASTGININSDDEFISSSVIFKDGTNTVTSIGNNGNAIGIVASSVDGGASAISFSGGTNNINVTSNSTFTATGIALNAGLDGSHSNYSPVGFSGGTNHITVTGVNGKATGIAMNAGSILTTNTHGNYINDNYTDALFIYGTNTITVNGNSTVKGIEANSYTSGEATFTLTGGTNVLDISGNNTTGIAASSSGNGISTINFNSNSSSPITKRARKLIAHNQLHSAAITPIAINVTGITSANGITADANSQLTIDGTALTSQSAVNSITSTYSSMTKTGTTTEEDYKLDWAGWEPVSW